MSELPALMQVPPEYYVTIPKRSEVLKPGEPHYTIEYPKYNDRRAPVLDVIIYEKKKAQEWQLGIFRRYFSPFSFQEPLVVDVNPFRIPKQSPILATCSFPRFWTCHICGGGFGYQSLKSHLKVCEELFEVREEQKDPGCPRIPLPGKPGLGPAVPDENDDGSTWTNEEIMAYNDAAREIYNQETMVKCERCQRTFRSDAFAVHYDGCPGPVMESAKVKPCSLCGTLLFSKDHEKYHVRKCRASKWDIPTAKPSMKPIKPCCYVCGKEQTDATIDNHMKMCERLWEDREKNKVYEDERLPLPPKVGPVGAGASWEAAAEAKKQCMLGCGAMTSCYRCNRTMLTEQFEKHIKGCKTQIDSYDDYAKKKKEGLFREPKGNFFRKDTVGKEIGVCCYICGKKFGTHSIEIHLKTCADMWKKRQTEGPDAEGKPCPERPSQFDDFKSGKITNGKWNTWVFENCGMYVPCKKCNRTFLPEQLPKHDIIFCQIIPKMLS